MTTSLFRNLMRKLESHFGIFRDGFKGILNQCLDVSACCVITEHDSGYKQATEWCNKLDALLFEISAKQDRNIPTGGCGSQLSEIDHCDPGELKDCVDLIPRTPVGLPKTKEDLDAHCQAYQTGMTCMDAWIKKCLPTDGQKLLQQQIGGARALMRFLCTNDTALRREFLKEPKCWGRVSPHWSHCVNELQEAVREIGDRAQQLTYFNRNGELCCARDAFIMCVADAGRSCSNSASTLLRRMAWVLAQDVAACSQQPRTYCAASPPPLATPLLTTLGFMLYPPRF